MIIPLWAKLLGVVGVIAAVLVGFDVYVASQRADERREVLSEVKDSQQQAAISDLKRALVAERQQNDITEKTNAKQASDLVAANGRLSDYLARLRAQAGRGFAATDVSGLSNSADQSDGADRLSLLDDDLRKCTALAVRLGNAKEWVEQQQRVER